jgi:hypothetical protein
MVPGRGKNSLQGSVSGDAVAAGQRRTRRRRPPEKFAPTEKNFGTKKLDRIEFRRGGPIL